MDSLKIYTILEPYLNDYRRVVYRRPEAALIESAAADVTVNEKVDERAEIKLKVDRAYKILFMDEFVERLLTTERLCDVTLPRLVVRWQYEQE